MDKDINKVFNILKTSTLPVIIPVHNSYERLCVYKAIEHYEQVMIIKLIKQRIHEWTDLKPKCVKCKRHWLDACGGCTECNDVWCTGPYCKKGCSLIMGSKFIDPDDKPLHKTKIITGIRISYSN